MKAKPSDFPEKAASNYLDLPQVTVLGAKTLDDFVDGFEIAAQNMPAFWDAPDWDGPTDEPFWMRPEQVFVDLKAKAVVPYWVAKGEPELELKRLPAIKVERQKTPSRLFLSRFLVCKLWSASIQFLSDVSTRINAWQHATFSASFEPDATQWCRVDEEFDYGGRLR